MLLCCYFCYCNAIIKTVALPLSNTVCMDGCNSNQNIQNTLRASRLWVSVGRSVGVLLMSCVHSTYHTAFQLINNWHRGRTCFVSIPPYDSVFYRRTIVDISRMFFVCCCCFALEHLKSIGDLDYEFCHFFPHEDLLQFSFSISNRYKLISVKCFSFMLVFMKRNVKKIKSKQNKTNTTKTKG